MGPSWVDPALVLLQDRGLDHERLYVEQLLEQGLAADVLADALSRTRA